MNAQAYYDLMQKVDDAWLLYNSLINEFEQANKVIDWTQFPLALSAVKRQISDLGAKAEALQAEAHRMYEAPETWQPTQKEIDAQLDRINGETPIDDYNCVTDRNMADDELAPQHTFSNGDVIELTKEPDCNCGMGNTYLRDHKESCPWYLPF